MSIAKKNWVVTYGSSRGYITFQMFRDEGSLDVDEVHSTSDGSLVFTYFHLKKRMRENAITKFMDKIKHIHGIIQNEVFGYDTIGSHGLDATLMDHIAFKMIFEHFKSGNPAFVSCTDGVHGVFRGLLMQTVGLARIKGVLSKRNKALIPVLEALFPLAGKHDGEKEEDTLTYDVVKKRRAMEAPENEHEENAPEALVAFEDFEQSVLTALENIRSDEEEFRKRELMEMEKSWAKGEAQPKTGGVYFAWSDCLKCMKIGATRREDPLVRLREISRFVTTPFVLAAWLPTPSPFCQEATAHRFFDEKRINFRGSGAGTEFFHVTTVEAVGYVSASP